MTAVSVADEPVRVSGQLEESSASKGRVLRINQSLRIVLITGGPAAGKTRLAQRLYGRLPKTWRFVSLDHFIEIALRNPAPKTDWPERTVQIAEVSLDYWRKEEVVNVLVEGVIQNEAQVRRLCKAFGVGWPSDQARLIQLERSFDTHRRRRSDKSAWQPHLEGPARDHALASLEARVPAEIPGARVVVTDQLSEEQVLEAVWRQLE